MSKGTSGGRVRRSGTRAVGDRGWAGRLVGRSLTLLLAGLLLARMGGPAPLAAQDDPVARRFAAMSPEERVGQLFLVAFFAADEAPLADVSTLVRDRHLGGVVLQKGNNVFNNGRGQDLPRSIAALTAELQRLALDRPGGGVPLFVAVDHEGNGDPLTHLREGFTALPSQMAIGATWDPEAARAVGAIAGRELEAVGVNLLLGPVLDVLADPRVDTGGDIGVRAFGGHPYWVGRMGEAYIQGVHEGGGGRVATVAKHFPGHGGSDRLPDDQIATINKALSELERVELPPFGAVVAPAAGRPSEGLMTSHIRYRGFQGNIQDATAPISFDPEGMRALFALPGFGFADWRAQGGLVVSDSLGVRAVKRLFDPALKTFPHRDIARQALLAGNDLLILAEYGIPAGWSLAMRNIEDTAAYFSAQYRQDPRFRARADEAALRVLRRKAALYPDWSLEAVAADPEALGDRVGGAAARETVAAIAREAVTILRRGAQPQRGDRILVITEDARRPGSDPRRRPLACPDESCGLAPERWERLTGLGPTLVEALILERYGPGGTGAIRAEDLASLSWCQLGEILVPAPPPTEETAPGALPEGGSPTAGPPSAEPAAAGAAAATPAAATPCLSPEDRGAALARLAEADWVVFAISDLRPEDVARLNGFYLDQIEKLSRARRAVLAFGPPYYVHASNLARLDALIVAYSRIPAAIEAGVDALFDVQLASEGRPGPPVTVEDAGYTLDEVVEPAPGPVLALELLAPDPPAFDALPARVRLAVGPIRDHNGNPVPDGTLVRLSAEPAAALPGGAVTVPSAGGRALAELQLGAGGRVAISAATTTGGAVSKAPLVIELPAPTPTLPAAPAGEPGAADGAGVADDGGLGRGAAIAGAGRAPGPDLADLLVALALATVVSGVVVGSPAWRRQAPEGQLRALLLVLAGGLGAYVALGLAAQLGTGFGTWLRPGLAAAAALGALAGMGLALARARRATRPSAPRPRTGGRGPG